MKFCGNLENAYEIELPLGFDHSPTFSISNLFNYHEGGNDVDVQTPMFIKQSEVGGEV